MEAAPTKLKVCSKCLENPPSNGNPWCQPCRTEHARQQRVTEAEMIGARNWMAGAAAMKRAFLERLAVAPNAMFQTAAIMRWMEDFPAPSFDRGAKDLPTENGK